VQRILVASLLGAAALLAWAEQPPRLEPLPEVPPPPPALRDAAPEEPRVVIRAGEGEVVEEIRDGGRVIAIRVTPRDGPPYFLVDTTGSGNWMRRDSLDDGVRVPMWILRTFD